MKREASAVRKIIRFIIEVDILDMETAENTTCQKRCCANGAHRVIKKVVCLILLVAALVWFDTNFHVLSASQENKLARAKLQAVFLTNGQIYFGALSRHGIGYWRLDRAHYLQTSKVPVVPSADAQEGAVPREETRTTLMKAGDDIHRPENTLFIPTDNILFWQNLRGDSPIAQTIIAEQ